MDEIELLRWLIPVSESLHALAPEPTEPLFSDIWYQNIRWPNTACFGMGLNHCKYHLLHSWDDMLMTLGFVISVHVVMRVLKVPIGLLQRERG